MKFLPISLFCLLFLSAPLALAGEPVSGKPASIPSITVYGDTENESQDVTADSTVIHVSDEQHSMDTVSDVLSSQGGVHLTRYGGLEDFTSVSIRGSQGDEVLILLDGIPLNSATGDSVDLSPYLLDSLDSIAIYRGSAPVQFGAAPAAGAVELNSKIPKKGKEVNASVGYGSFNTVSSHAHYSQANERYGFLLSTSYLRTDGDFSFLDDNGTPANPNDDQRVKRQNNASQTVHPFFKIFYNFDSKTKMEWLIHFIRKDAGVPGLSTNQSQTADLSTTTLLSSFKIHRDSFFSQKISFESLTSVKVSKSQFSDPNGEIGLGGAQDNDDDTTFFNHQFTWNYYPDRHQNVTSFFLYQMEDFRPQNFLATPSHGSTSVRQMWNVGAGDEIDLLNHRLYLNPAVWFSNVFDRINNNDPSFLTPATFTDSSSHHVVSEKMGVKGMITPWLSMPMNVSHSYRFPTFSELFGDRGGVVGNPLLKPQVSLNWDIGFELDRKSPHPPFDKGGLKGDLSVFYFERRIDNLIQFEQNSGFARAENVGSARIRGVETMASADFFKHVRLSANYTFQDPKDEGNNPGKFIPGQPQHEADAELTGYNKRGKIFLAVNWMDSTFLDPLNTRVIQNRLILNSGLSFSPNSKTTLSFEGKNLSNNQIYDVVGFPLPGRSFFGRIEYKL